MLRRENGLDYFFQWDYNQRLIVDDKDISEVHFCNKITDCSYVCETYTENEVLLVNVPNILLQTDWEIEAYAYIGNCIKSSERFDIVSRAKPDNYIYEETEILNYDTLVSRMDTIEDSIPGAVADYMEANPIKFPVDSVNGKTGAVRLAAADVGALPADTVIPSTVGLATEKYVDAAVAAIPQPDLSGYATKNDINGLATTNYVDEKVSGVKVDLSDYATKTFVSEELAKIEDVDLTNYYTKSETDTKIGEAVAAIPQPDLTNYATTGYVDEKVAAIDIPEVEIDGKRIIKNDEGKLSTSVGGAVIRDYIETPIFDWTGSAPISETLDASTATVNDIPGLYGTINKIYLTIDDVEYVAEVRGVGAVINYRYELNIDGCPIDTITVNVRTGVFKAFTLGATATGNEVITALKMIVVEDNGYTYEKLCGHCIPVGTGLAINYDETNPGELLDGVPAAYVAIDEAYMKDLIAANSSSVAVDGETILQNADGTISTAVGGYRTEPQVIYTWTGSTPAGEEVDEPEIAPFEGLSVDDTITITYTIDGAEYTEEFNVDTKSLAKIIASNNDDGLLTEVVIGIRYETMTYEFEGTALTAVSISDNGGYVCINSNYINIGAGLEKVGSEIVVDDAYIGDLISDAGVPVDGTTIIANAKGNISTSIGGAVITTPDEEYFNYTDEPIVLMDALPVDAGLADSNNLEDLEDGTDVIVTIVVNKEEYVIETTASNNGTTISIDLSDESMFSNFEYNIDDGTFTLVPGSDAMPDHEITDIVIAVPGSVAYEQIDSNVVNIGTGLKINERGSIAVDAAYIESIIANYLATTGV